MFHDNALHKFNIDMTLTLTNRSFHGRYLQVSILPLADLPCRAELRMPFVENPAFCVLALCCECDSYIPTLYVMASITKATYSTISTAPSSATAISGQLFDVSQDQFAYIYCAIALGRWNRLSNIRIDS